MPLLSILIVDDNPVNVKLVRVVLEASGYQISTAGDAEQALELLQEVHPTLILMDLQLPGMSGLQLTRHLREAEATRKLPIIALTAYAMVGDEERALQAGCDAYLTKPLDLAVLRETVARVLRKSA